MYILLSFLGNLKVESRKEVYLNLVIEIVYFKYEGIDIFLLEWVFVKEGGDFWSLYGGLGNGKLNVILRVICNFYILELLV